MNKFPTSIVAIGTPLRITRGVQNAIVTHTIKINGMYNSIGRSMLTHINPRRKFAFNEVIKIAREKQQLILSMALEKIILSEE